MGLHLLLEFCHLLVVFGNHRLVVRSQRLIHFLVLDRDLVTKLLEQAALGCGSLVVRCAERGLEGLSLGRRNRLQFRRDQLLLAGCLHHRHACFQV